MDLWSVPPSKGHQPIANRHGSCVLEWCFGGIDVVSADSGWL
jgi:hypothetical protein